MDTLFSRLLTQVYELEGLLLVVDKHGDDTPAVVYQRIGELGDDVARRTRELADRATEACQKPATVCAAPVEPVAEPVVEDRLPERDYDADETWQHDNGEEFKEVFSVDYEEPSLVVEPQQQVMLVEPRPADEAEADAQPADDDLRIDEKLHRSLSKDMHKALSLNDRFRFKRELFSNSDVELNNALDLVNAMQGYAEAEEYFLSDLGWDQDNEDVADFMGLVRRHFL